MCCGAGTWKEKRVQILAFRAWTMRQYDKYIVPGTVNTIWNHIGFIVNAELKVKVCLCSFFFFLCIPAERLGNIPSNVAPKWKVSSIPSQTIAGNLIIRRSVALMRIRMLWRKRSCMNMDSFYFWAAKKRLPSGWLWTEPIVAASVRCLEPPGRRILLSCS